MLAQMSDRERKLAIITGTAIFLLLNYLLLQFFIGNHTTLRKTLATAESRIAGFKRQDADREKWSQREAWLNQSLVPLGDPDVANKHLREAILDLSKKHTVTLESPAPGVPNAQPNYTSLGVRVEAKGEWKNMLHFLHEVQSPGQFLVIEGMELKVDPADKTQLRGSMTIAKWFAPAAR